MDTSVLQCSQCGLVFFHPVPTERDLLALYRDYDPGEDEEDFLAHLAWRRQWRLPVFREALDEVLRYKQGGGRLLEIGCSFGFFLRMARERGLEPYGVDLSLNAVRYAEQNLRLSVRRGTVFDAKFPEGFFDITAMLGVLEHLHNPLETLREVSRILRTEGLLIVEVPNAHFNLLRGRLSPSLFYVGNHLFNFTPKALSRMLETAGFRCVKIWCGKADHPRGWFFNGLKSSCVLAARLVHRAFGCCLGPSLVAIAVKA
jgi:SAM-dependent methyltransferase